ARLPLQRGDVRRAGGLRRPVSGGGVRPVPALEGAVAGDRRRLDRPFPRAAGRQTQAVKLEDGPEALPQRVLPPPALDLVPPPRDHHPRHGQALRRGQIHLGLGLPPLRRQPGGGGRDQNGDLLSPRARAAVDSGGECCTDLQSLVGPAGAPRGAAPLRTAALPPAALYSLPCKGSSIRKGFVSSAVIASRAKASSESRSPPPGRTRLRMSSGSDHRPTSSPAT